MILSAPMIYWPHTVCLNWNILFAQFWMLATNIQNRYTKTTASSSQSPPLIPLGGVATSSQIEANVWKKPRASYLRTFRATTIASSRPRVSKFESDSHPKAFEIIIFTRPKSSHQVLNPLRMPRTLFEWAPRIAQWIFWTYRKHIFGMLFVFWRYTRPYVIESCLLFKKRNWFVKKSCRIISNPQII